MWYRHQVSRVLGGGNQKNFRTAYVKRIRNFTLWAAIGRPDMVWTDLCWPEHMSRTQSQLHPPLGSWYGAPASGRHLMTMWPPFIWFVALGWLGHSSSWLCLCVCEIGFESRAMTALKLKSEIIRKNHSQERNEAHPEDNIILQDSSWLTFERHIKCWSNTPIHRLKGATSIQLLRKASNHHFQAVWKSKSEKFLGSQILRRP